jgi:sec-independent protein translocase protein TatA
MFGNLGFGELMVIMVIVLVLFGAKRVPEISASFGKGIREFKRNLNDVETSLMDTRVQQPIARRTENDATAQPSTYVDDVTSEPKRLL